MTEPSGLVDELGKTPTLQGDERLYVSWTADLENLPATSEVRSVRATGATPWLSLVFRTPVPLLQNLDALSRDLELLATLAERSEDETRLQILWQPGGAEAIDPTEYAFLLKRAAVTVTGVQPNIEVITAPLEPDDTFLRRLYAEEIAAYVDGVALRPADPGALTTAIATLAELDPGRPVILDALPRPAEGSAVVAEAARYAEMGVSITLFDLQRVDAATLLPLKLLAREFQGDLSFDPYSIPAGGLEAWSFVRGSDLGLRVIVRVPAGTEELTLRFADPSLQSPDLVDLASGEVVPQYGVRRSRRGLRVDIADPGSVVLLRVERSAVPELAGVEGIEEEVDVEAERYLPVGEILRRLQAFEDVQARRLDHYRAVRTAHLRFVLGGVQNVEFTFEGDFFFRPGEVFDWAWQTMYVNGVRWRSKRIPKIPLIQPEKAAAMPLEIHFTKEYRYRLRGTATVSGRDCWVVDFQPLKVTPGHSLYQGTVWIDRAHYGRVQTRAVQVGLEGEVISNEETAHFVPLDESGAPTEWQPESYWLPVRVVGQQIFSILNATVVVEREIVLSNIAINGNDFEDLREITLASEATMVRDTEQGLRYLVLDKESGNRELQTLDANRFFLVGGVFWDESLDYPVPLGGVNYLSFDFKGTGSQVNAFFAGVLLDLSIADPNFLGSKFDAGADLFALAFRGTDTVFRNGEEVKEEDVKSKTPSFELSLGRPIGSFFKLDFEYGLSYTDFAGADDTAPEFVLPVDHFTHSVSLTARYNRAGYRFRLGGSYHARSEWKFWGLPGNEDFDPEAKEYSRWGAGVAKIWHLPNFRKFGAEVEYVDGSNLDRFSKYEFGFFSSVRVRGYQSDKVRASEAWAGHLSYGFDLGNLFRLDVVGDVAWATDEAAGFDNEFLAGAGLVGNLVGPWRTLINVDTGVALAGPDDGFVLFLAFLKLFS